MTATNRTGFPRRDPGGRIAVAGDLLGLTLAYLVIGLLGLVAFDVVFALLDLAEFGRASGWLAVVLPGWLFVEEFRVERYGAARVAAALVATGVGVALGLLAAGLAAELPPLAGGAAGATACALGYALVWFYGLRWLQSRTG